MKILGLDWGEKKVGVAVSYGLLADPIRTIRYVSPEKLILELRNIVNKEGVEKIVIGVSEGRSRDKAQDFGKLLEEELKLQVEYFDETLSTHEAKEKTREAGIQRKKGKEMEDAYAAAVMLQNYLDIL